MKKETQGKTDLYIGSWLKSQPRDKVLNAHFSTLFMLLWIQGFFKVHDYFQCETMLLKLDCLVCKRMELLLSRFCIEKKMLIEINFNFA